jgi:phage terminase large subunit
MVGYKNYDLLRSTSNLSVTLLGNNSVIRLRPFADEGTMRGGDVNWIWLDEAIGKDRIHLTEARFKQVRARLRRGSGEQLLVTTNPGPQTHFLYRYFVSDNMPGRDVIYGSIYDNRKVLGEEYIKDMELTYPEDELKGKWSRAFGTVYEDFDHAKHVSKFNADPDWTYYLGVDFGFTNPFACILVGVDKDNSVYVIDEYYKTKTLLRDHIKTIKERYLKHYPVRQMLVDPEDAQAIAQVKADIKIPVTRGRNNVKRGIDSVTKLFRSDTPKGPRINIHSRCSQLIAELENYAWEEPREGRNEKEEPIKFMDHGLDALRYLVFTVIESNQKHAKISFNKYR